MKNIFIIVGSLFISNIYAQDVAFKAGNFKDKKDEFKKVSKKNNLNKSEKNYNDYAFSLLFNKSVKSSLKSKKIKY